MKKSSFILALSIAIFGFSAFTFISNPEGNQNQPTTIIKWTGSKVIGDSHTGTIQVKENNLKFTDGVLTSGNVIADMTTIVDLDLDGEWNTKLVGHLNSDEFFSTKKYPTSTIAITKVSAAAEPNTYDVIADITIKGITNSESFQVRVYSYQNNYVLSANFDINRTKYNIKYGSSSYFDELGDKAINDKFNLNVTLVSTLS